MAQIPETYLDLIENNQIVNLGTVGPKGEPQVTALWFVRDGDTVSMSINEARQKLKNLRRDPRASLLFVDPANPYRTLELRGTVSIEPDPEYVFAEKVNSKYGADVRQMDGEGETRFRVTLKIEKVNAFGQ